MSNNTFCFIPEAELFEVNGGVSGGLIFAGVMCIAGGLLVCATGGGLVIGGIAIVGGIIFIAAGIAY